MPGLIMPCMPDIDPLDGIPDIRDIWGIGSLDIDPLEDMPGIMFCIPVIGDIDPLDIDPFDIDPWPEP